MFMRNILYGRITGRFSPTTTVICNCDKKEVMEYEGIHFNSKPFDEPIHLYDCRRCGGDIELDDSLLRDKEGNYKERYII